MKPVSCLRDLDQFGIIALTGEADALSFRTLCDLTPWGRRIVAETFSIGPDSFPPNYNSSRGAVSSCLLPQDSEFAMTLAVIAGCLEHRTVIVTDHGAFILDTDEEIVSPIYKDVYDADGSWKDCTLVEDYKYRRRNEEDQPWPTDCYGKIRRVFRRQTNPDPGVVEGLRNVHQMSGRVV